MLLRANDHPASDTERGGLLQSARSSSPEGSTSTAEARDWKELQVPSCACCVSILAAFAVALGLAAGTLAAQAQRGHHGGAAGREARAVRKLVEEPNDMFTALGFVSAPLLIVSLKGLLNFSVQIVLYLGEDVLRGAEAVKAKLAGPLRLSNAFVGFQLLGLATTAFVYAQMTVALAPWRSRAAFQTFALAISQHSATGTLLVGLATNLVLAVADVPGLSSEAQEDGRSVAWRLAVAGAAVSSPLLLTFVGTAWAQIPFILAAMVFALRAQTIVRLLGDTFSGQAFAREGTSFHNLLSCSRDPGVVGWASYGCVFATGLTAAWLIAGAARPGAWRFAGAAILEVAAPLAATRLVFSRVLRLQAAECPQLLALALSMQCAYVVVLVVPASLLTAEPTIGLNGSAAVAFAGKRWEAFVQYTFCAPSQGSSKPPHGGDHSLTLLWLGQLISLLT